MLLAELRGAGRLKFSRASIDGANVPSPRGGPNPTDWGKLGSKRHVVTDRAGIALVFCVAGANRHDSIFFEELIDDLPVVRGLPGRPRRGLNG